MEFVQKRDWSRVATELASRSPGYAVLDNFLQSQVAWQLHQQLLEHWGWRKKNWVSAHLHNAEPRIDICAGIAEEFILSARPAIRDLEVCSYWALLFPNNTMGNVHADAGKLTLTVWLTPERHNLDRQTGGLLLYDVSRHTSQSMHEYLVPPASADYVRQHSKGKVTRIAYQWNRAVLFDASTFHRTDDLRFNTSAGPASARMNLSFALDHPEDYHAQFQHDIFEKHPAQPVPILGANKTHKPQ